MKIYGYSLENAEELREMSEISLQVSPGRLREIAAFLMSVADKFEKPNSQDHFHFQDYSEDWDENFPDIVVFNDSK